MRFPWATQDLEDAPDRLLGGDLERDTFHFSLPHKWAIGPHCPCTPLKKCVLGLLLGSGSVASIQIRRWGDVASSGKYQL